MSAQAEYALPPGTMPKTVSGVDENGHAGEKHAGAIAPLPTQVNWSVDRHSLSGGKGVAETADSAAPINDPSTVEQQRVAVDDWASQGMEHTTSAEADEAKRRQDEQIASESQKHVNAISTALQGINRKKTRFFDWETKLINSASPFATAWDIQTTVLLVTTAIMTPYEVTFGPEKPKLDGAFFLNICIDFCFFVDMIFQFFIPFPDPTSGQMVSYHPLIRKRYLRGWFVIDLVSILPFNAINYMVDSKALSSLKILRAVRLLRLAKLLRVLRGLRMFKRWESRLAVNYALLNLSFLCMVLVFGCHWLACGYGFIITMDAEADWKEAFPYTYDPDSAWDKFSAAIYWSVGMVTGQGDPFALHVHTVTMRTTYTIVAGIAGVANAYLIGGVVSLLERMNERKSEFYRDMDILNEFIQNKSMADGTVLMDGKTVRGDELCQKLRSYFIFRHSHGKLSQSFRQIISACSKQMQQTISAKVHTADLHNINFFKDASQEFVTQLAHEIHSHIYAARETVFDVEDTVDELFIIEKGLVFAKGKIVRDNDVFGEEVFEHAGGKRGYLAYTLSEVVLLVIKADAIKTVVERCGNAMMRVRLKVIGALNRLKNVTKRAAKVTISRQNFYDGYEVLRMEYPDDILEVEDSPIIGLMQIRISSYLDMMEEHQSDLKNGGTGLQRLQSVNAGTVFCLENRGMMDGSGSPLKSRSRRSSLVKDTDVLDDQFDVAGMRKAARQFFGSIEKRINVRQKDEGSVSSELNTIRKFLRRVDGRDMTNYTKILHEENHLRLSSLRDVSDPATEVRKTQLMLLGIPYVDAHRIAEAATNPDSMDLSAVSRSGPESFRRPTDIVTPMGSPRKSLELPAARDKVAPLPAAGPGAGGQVCAAGQAVPPAPSPVEASSSGVGWADGGDPTEDLGALPWTLDPKLTNFMRSGANFRGGQHMGRYVTLLGVQQRMTFDGLMQLDTTCLGALVSIGVRVGDAQTIIAACQLQRQAMSSLPSTPTPE